MDATGQRSTFDAAAREAGVSRSWLYTQDDLRAEIQQPPPAAPGHFTAAGSSSAAARPGLLAATPPRRGHRPHPPTGSRQPATPRRARPSPRRTPGRRSTRPQRQPRHAEEELTENCPAVLNRHLARSVNDTVHIASPQVKAMIAIPAQDNGR